MAGPTPGTVIQLRNAASVTAGSTQTDEIDTGQCYGVIIIVNTDLDPSATDGATLKVYTKTGASGTKTNKPIMTITLDYDPDGVSFLLDPGTYSIELTNDDATYALTNSIWYRLLT